MKREEAASFLLLYTVRYSIKALKKKHALSLSCDFRGLRKIAKKTIRFVKSVCPHATTRLPLDGFSLNSIFWVFSENLSRKFMFR